MFRIDSDEVVDATMSGNEARFINHACEVSMWAVACQSVSMLTLNVCILCICLKAAIMLCILSLVVDV